MRIVALGVLIAVTVVGAISLLADAWDINVVCSATDSSSSNRTKIQSLRSSHHGITELLERNDKLTRENERLRQEIAKLQQQLQQLGASVSEEKTQAGVDAFVDDDTFMDDDDDTFADDDTLPSEPESPSLLKEAVVAKEAQPEVTATLRVSTPPVQSESKPDNASAEKFPVAKEAEPAVTSTDTTEDPPVVSFIIPSTLTRDSLHDTLWSLLNQKNVTNWEAIVGVDTRVGGASALEKASQFEQDPRIRYVPITTPDKDRGKGKTHNGSGQVRNQIIQQHAKAEWVAFVDDDDTLSPWYAKKLFETIDEAFMESNDEPDVIIWRMMAAGHRGRGKKFIPSKTITAKGVTKFHVGTVGISFAVRRDLFMNSTTEPMEFKPSAVEDYAYLKGAHKRGFNIRLSTCVMYFVRRGPEQAEQKCKLEHSTMTFE